MIAVQNEHVDIVTALILRKSPVNLQDRNEGISALHLACQKDLSGMANVLLKADALPNLQVSCSGSFRTPGKNF